MNEPRQGAKGLAKTVGLHDSWEDGVSVSGFSWPGDEDGGTSGTNAETGMQNPMKDECCEFAGSVMPRRRCGEGSPTEGG